MNAQDCLQILREIKDVAFATADREGKPKVRIIDVMLVEQGRLIFCTARGKAFYRQLLDRPEVAVTGMNRQFQMVRLEGRVKKLDRQRDWIDRIFEENPAMRDVYPGNARYILEPFRIEDAVLEFFDLGRQPIYRESFSLGGISEEEKGFMISESCIQCGSCLSICPQRCIQKGTPYRIQQEHCLHCGLCAENCPAEAIKRRRSIC